MGQNVSWLFSGDGLTSQVVSRLAAGLPSFVKRNRERFVPEEEDILATQAVLLNFVPLEIINLILDEAEYWPRLISQKESDPPLKVSASLSPNNDATHCYFISPRIPERCPKRQTKMKLRRVVFHVISHDQGWGGDPGLTGLYDGSYTWFEASIIRGLKLDDERSPEVIHSVIREATERPESKREGLPFQVPNPTNGGNVWHLQSNVRTSLNPEMHEIVWNLRDSASPGFMEEDNEISADTGSGYGRGFVASLQSGDSIAVFARAKFPGWTNHVIFVDVQIFYAL